MERHALLVQTINTLTLLSKLVKLVQEEETMKNKLKSAIAQKLLLFILVPIAYNVSCPNTLICKRNNAYPVQPLKFTTFNQKLVYFVQLKNLSSTVKDALNVDQISVTTKQTSSAKIVIMVENTTQKQSNANVKIICIFTLA